MNKGKLHKAKRHKMMPAFHNWSAGIAFLTLIMGERHSLLYHFDLFHSHTSSSLNSKSLFASILSFERLEDFAGLHR